MLTKLDTKHIGILDGVRVLAIFFVAWFHFWQQTWISPVIKGPITINFTDIVRSGYLFVDIIILISGFCLFLPYARASIAGEAWPDTRLFYKKRALRIIPSYAFLIIIVFLFFASVNPGYESARDAVFDLFTNLTFTSIHVPSIFPILAVSGAIWTVMVEVHYYLIFPFLARAFSKHIAPTYIILCIIGVLSCRFIIQDEDFAVRYVNHLLTFAAVYANGMLGAYVYVWYSTKKKHSLKVAIPATILSIACIIAYVFTVKQILDYDVMAFGQLVYRNMLSVLFLVFILSTALSIRWYQILFSNPLARFLSMISYNFYLWHQLIAVKFKEGKIPYWSGKTPPNILGDTAWMWKYQLIILSVSLAIACALTFGLERPIVQLFSKKKPEK